MFIDLLKEFFFCKKFGYSKKELSANSFFKLPCSFSAVYIKLGVTLNFNRYSMTSKKRNIRLRFPIT